MNICVGVYELQHFKEVDQKAIVPPLGEVLAQKRLIDLDLSIKLRRLRRLRLFLSMVLKDYLRLCQLDDRKK